MVTLASAPKSAAGKNASAEGQKQGYQDKEKPILIRNSNIQAAKGENNVLNVDYNLHRVARVGRRGV